jgi:hypothetical protein
VIGGEIQHGLVVRDAAAAAPDHALPARYDGQGRQLKRFARCADDHHVPPRLQQLQQWHELVPRRNGVDDAVRGGHRGLHLLRVAADKEPVGAEAVERLLALARRRADDRDPHPERLAELHGKVAEADDAQIRSGSVEAVLHHRAVHRDASAEQWRGSVRGQGLRDSDDVVLTDDEDVREAALSGGAVGCLHEMGAVALLSDLAVVAGAAGVNEVADANHVADLELGDSAADVRDRADDLVSALLCTTLTLDEYIYYKKTQRNICVCIFTISQFLSELGALNIKYQTSRLVHKKV